MLRFVFNRILCPPVGLHVALTLGAAFLLILPAHIVTALYEASGHPATFVQGQMRFDGAAIKADLAATVSLDLFRQSQLFDFGLMLAISLLGLTLATLIARMGRDGSLGRKLCLYGAGSIILAEGFDALENLVSLVMIANPSGFPNWLAYPYSSFALMKFLLLYSGLAALAGAALLIAIGRVSNRPKLG